MGTVHTIENHLTAISRTIRRVLVSYSERQNIQKKRKLIDKVSLTETQKQEIKEFFRKNYGKSLSTAWHRLYQSYTGIYCKDYFPEILFSTRLEPKLNPYREAEILGDKSFLPLLFSGIEGLHIPQTYLSCVKGIYRNGNNALLSPAEAYMSLFDRGKCVVKKTIDTSSGRDVQICNFVGGQDIGSSLAVREVLEKFGNNFVVQELIHQADVLATLNPSSVNTFRVITYILDDRIHICPIELRLGRSSSDRDNIHYGGVCIGINADGTLKKEAFSEQGEHFVFHPDTKVKFSGYNIGGGNLTRIKETVLKMHANLPYLGILSWDLSLDTEGAVVLIEVNTTGQSAWFCQMVNGESLFGENTGKMLQLIRK